METSDRISLLSPVKQAALRKLLADKDIGDERLLAVSGSSLRVLREGSPILFLYPATDGSVGYLRHYLPHIPESWGVYALQTPGLEGECEPYVTVAELASHGIEQIRRIQPEGPYHLAGNCMGGLPAYETARQLHEAGATVRTVLHLLPNFNRPWKELPTAPAKLRVRVLHDYLYIIERLLGVKVDVSMEALSGLDAEEQLTRVVDAVQEHGRIDSADAATIRARIRIYEANLSAMLTYDPPTHYPGQVTILAVGEELRGEHAIHALSPYASPLRGLRLDQIDTVFVEADGGALFDGAEPHMTVIGRAIRELLDR